MSASLPLIIYSAQPANRLTYILDFIFKETFGVSYTITHNTDFGNDSFVINYSNDPLPGTYHIVPNNLLFQNEISPINISVRNTGVDALFFENTLGDFPFDVFAAVFYLISRYEEYLPHQKDEYGRFPHKESLAFKNEFLQLPLIDIWLIKFRDSLKKFFSGLDLRSQSLSFLPTYDIDHAYAFKGKSALRVAAGIAFNSSKQRLKYLLGNSADPNDSYEFLNILHSKYKLRPIYFFLVAEKDSAYDKNISPNSPELKSLIKNTSAQYAIGIHPSWQSFLNKKLVQSEINALQEITVGKITRSRQHYLRMQLPETYEMLIQLGIQQDYTMGYGTINGFRASTGRSFFWFNLATNSTTALKITPFCFMDANCIYEQKIPVEQAAKELRNYLNICHEYSTQLCTLFHNNVLGANKMFKGWAEMYEQFISNVAAYSLHN